MKNTILLAIAVIGITSASCRKERTCECKTTSTEVRTGFGAQTKVENSSSKTTRAKQMKKPFLYSTDCFSGSYVDRDSGGNGSTAWTSETTYVTECELK